MPKGSGRPTNKIEKSGLKRLKVAGANKSKPGSSVRIEGREFMSAWSDRDKQAKAGRAKGLDRADQKTYSSLYATLETDGTPGSITNKDRERSRSSSVSGPYSSKTSPMPTSRPPPKPKTSRRQGRK